MNDLASKTIINPVSGEKASFLYTSQETNGEKTVIEIEIQANGDGPPPHSHQAYSETFKVIEGEITIQVGKQNSVLLPGKDCKVEKLQIHTFSNKSAAPARIQVTLTPGHPGFEKAITILFGLAKDGLTNKKGVPKKLIHLAIINRLSDSHFTGFLSFISFLLNLMIKSKKMDLVQAQLIDKYCN